MFCKLLQKDVNEKQCMICWRNGQKQVWYKRMVEDYGAKPGSGHTAHILRRDCMLVNVYNKIQDCQRPVPKERIME